MRQAYANDLSNPQHLIAVRGSVNSSKSHRGPEDWRPPLVDYWCTYATDWIVIKYAWSLGVTMPESDALGDMLAYCYEGRDKSATWGALVEPDDQ